VAQFFKVNEKTQSIMKKNTWNILLIVILFLSFSCGEKKADDTKEIAEDQNEEKFDDTNLEDDTEFAVAAADAGMMEVQLGQLALTNASSAEVKQFAQSMVDDHSKANEELKGLAQKKNITLPAALSDKMKKKYDDFVEKRGEEFDIDDHKDVVDKFEKEADKGKDPDLKAWAASKIPTLKHHLEMAEQRKDIVKKKD
jgi:putative membrane protein